MKQEENHWSKLLTQANERTRKYANLISQGVDSDTATSQVYGAIMSREIAQDIIALEDATKKVTQNVIKQRIPDDGC